MVDSLKTRVGRIIAGSGPGRDVRTSGEYYYTDDHYASFRRIDGIPAP